MSLVSMQWIGQGLAQPLIVESKLDLGKQLVSSPSYRNPRITDALHTRSGGAGCGNVLTARVLPGPCSPRRRA
ncbi:MAG: hypothetical protein ABW123_07445 [Cystobacter sp.]